MADRCRYLTTKKKGSSKKHQPEWEGKKSSDEGQSTNLCVLTEVIPGLFDNYFCGGIANSKPFTGTTIFVEESFESAVVGGFFYCCLGGVDFLPVAKIVDEGIDKNCSLDRVCGKKFFVGVGCGGKYSNENSL